jgi:hypothetical protein
MEPLAKLVMLDVGLALDLKIVINVILVEKLKSTLTL